MFRAVFIAAFLSGIIAVLVLAADAGAPSQRISFTESTISARIDRLPIRDLLKEISAYGISVSIDTSISHVVTADISNVPIADGLRRLFAPLSYSVVWTAIETPAGTISKLSEIHVFRPGKTETPPPLSESTIFEVITDPDTGALMIAGEVLLAVNPGADVAALKAVLKVFGAVIVDHHLDSGLLRLRFADPAQVNGFSDALAASGIDAVSEPHYAYELPRLSRQGPGKPGSNTLAAESNGAPPIAVLDSGITAGSLPAALTVAPFNAIDPGAGVDDRIGHGTHMALIASGRAIPAGAGETNTTGVPVIPIKIFDENGITSNFTVIRALSHAAAHGAKVVSLSWGSETDSGFLKDILAEVGSSGTVLLAASGNLPTGAPVYPAAYPSVLGIGALSPDGAIWESSNYGSFVAHYAPGLVEFDGADREQEGAFAGTSVATAFTAHRLAVYLTDNPDHSVRGFLATIP